MKKILLLTIAVFAASCSEEDAVQVTNTPASIVGEWKQVSAYNDVTNEAYYNTTCEDNEIYFHDWVFTDNQATSQNTCVENDVYTRSYTLTGSNLLIEGSGGLTRTVQTLTQDHMKILVEAEFPEVRLYEDYERQ